jgi:hypothetical protein
MACKHFGLAEITKRNDTSFGVMKMHKTVEGQTDSLLKDWAILSTLLTPGLMGTTQVKCL